MHKRMRKHDNGMNISHEVALLALKRLAEKKRGAMEKSAVYKIKEEYFWMIIIIIPLLFLK